MAGDRTRARGELESEVMRILWDRSALLSGREIQDLFSGPTPAYTTLMTALHRLEKKGEVAREGQSARKVRFRAVRSGEEHVSREMTNALEAAGDRGAALLRFAGNLGEEELELLRQAILPKKSR